jgi:hypothetical protein
VRRLALVLSLICLPAGVPDAAEIGPETALCAALQGLPPGEELALRPGSYRAGCAIRRGGAPGAPLVIRSVDAEHPAHLLPSPDAVTILSVRASDVVLRGLHFGPAGGDIDGIRVLAGQRIRIEECRFTGMGGFAVVAADTSVRGLTVRGNVISDSAASGMSFGCPDGISCVTSGLVVQGNVIRSLSPVGPQTGYGVQVQLNSSGIIRDNVTMDTKGPGIMVHGSTDLTTATLIERNFTQGSRGSSGIVVGGGPAVVRNNVAAWNFDAGISLQNHMRRGILRAVVVVHNSVYANRHAGIEAPGHSPVQGIFLNNAIHAPSGARALPMPRPGLVMRGNVDCSWAPCFLNPEALDFSPFAGSALMGRGLYEADPAVPTDDFFAARRGTPPTVGAVDQPSGAIRIAPRP